jgi:hypothetical protein
MLTLEAVKDRLGLDSVRQVRHRIDTARQLLAPYLKHGKNNQLLVDSNAIVILDRLRQLESRGQTLEQAVQEIQTETQGNGNGKPSSTTGELEVNHEGKIAGVENVRLKEQVSDLRGMVTFLQDQLNKRDEQILALMPAKGEARPGRPGPGERKLSRWQALRFVLLGR